MKTDMSSKLKVMAYALIVALMLSVAQGASADEIEWLTEMSPRLKLRMPDEKSRIALLKTVRYESNRVGLNPQLVLSLIDVASGFKKYAVSAEGARGLMQVAPSWVKKIGAPGDDLFGLRKNIRYGCVILRHFLDLENGDLLKALGRYRSQIGGLVEVEGEPVVSSFDFPRTVERMSKTRWRYDGPLG
jgi:soluble lytic murein transglycosylase-like protein